MAKKSKRGEAPRFNNWKPLALRARPDLPTPGPLGMCSLCRKKFVSDSVDEVRKMLLEHWESAHRKGEVLPAIPPPSRYNGNYPIMKDEDDSE